MGPAVAYIRVSKPKQGRSGLGLEAQQAAIKTFCAQHGYKIEAEYREVETGKGADMRDAAAHLPGADYADFLDIERHDARLTCCPERLSAFQVPRGAMFYAVPQCSATGLCRGGAALLPDFSEFQGQFW